jgi:hypothetical protein
VLSKITRRSTVKHRKLIVTIAVLLLIVLIIFLMFAFMYKPNAQGEKTITFTVTGYVYVPDREGAADGMRLKGIMVSLNESDGLGGWTKNVLSSVTTDGNGTFRFTGVPPSPESQDMLSVNTPGFKPAKVFITVTSDVTQNINLTPTSDQTYTVWGYVYDSLTQKTLTGAMLTLDSSNSRMTLQDGYYIFTCSSLGNHNFAVQANGYITKNSTVSINGQKLTYRVDFYLDKGNMVPPIARFTQSAYTAPVKTAIVFDPSASSDADGKIVKYEWDWEGNGVFEQSFTSAEPVVHVYSFAGKYHPTLRVTDNDGNTDTARSSEDSTLITIVNSVPEAPLGTIAAVAIMVTALLAVLAVTKFRRC